MTAVPATGSETSQTLEPTAGTLEAAERVPDAAERAPDRTAGDTGTSGAGRASRRRWRWRRLRWLPLVPPLVVVAALGAAWLVTPTVDDAQARVRALATLHAAGPLATDLPGRVAAAVLAVEDHRFYRHRGIDMLALPRSAQGVVTGNDAGGATIEVQLAKWLYTGGRRDHADQVRQAVLAEKLDLRWSKRQILLMYLNTVYFGHGYYGVTAASRGYFGRSPDQLDWAQAALLAAVLKAPASFDPRVHPETARERRDYALHRLAAVGAITPAELATAKASDLDLARTP